MVLPMLPPRKQSIDGKLRLKLILIYKTIVSETNVAECNLYLIIILVIDNEQSRSLQHTIIIIVQKCIPSRKL